MGDLPLQFYEFTHIDHEQRCPKYYDVTRRPLATGIQSSEVDELYTDLETLLGAANIRMRRLESESKILTEWCDKKGLVEQYPNKKNRSSLVGEERVTKKQKIEEGKSSVSKAKNKSTTNFGEKSNSEDVEMYVSKPKASYDAPNKFWSLVEPYCADLTVDDLNLLEEMNHNDCDDLYNIPPLGRHYTQRWMEEDLLEEQREGTKTDRRRTTGSQNALGNSNATNVDVDSSMDKKQQEIATAVEDHCSYGTFTQRLISSFVDENIMTPIGEDVLGLGSAIADDTRIEPLTARSVNVSNTKPLETAIKEELFSIGLIDSVSDDESDAESEDEVLAELKRHQNELRAISTHNKNSSEQLLNNARQEMKRQEFKQRIKAIDAEVMDAFRKITAAKQKKKIITKKERDLAWKALRDREAVLKLLDASDT